MNLKSYFQYFFRRIKIYQPKIKCKSGGSYFEENQKYRPLEIEKNTFFSVNSFEKILIFHIYDFKIIIDKID